MTRQERFLQLLNKHGYSSLNSFCNENGLQQANFNRRLKYEDMKVDMLTLFTLANILHEPIETMIEIFYAKELQENRDILNS